jgi:hypothetical protein
MPSLCNLLSRFLKCILIILMCFTPFLSFPARCSGSSSSRHHALATHSRSSRPRRSHHLVSASAVTSTSGGRLTSRHTAEDTPGQRHSRGHPVEPYSAQDSANGERKRSRRAAGGGAGGERERRAVGGGGGGGGGERSDSNMGGIPLSKLICFYWSINVISH